MNNTENRDCFACGVDNQRGLHLVKERTVSGARCEFLAETDLCGYTGVLHGGIQAVILDEIMGEAVNSRLGTAVAVEMKIKYRNPGFTGRRMVCEAELTSLDGRKANTCASIRDTESGCVVSEATGFYLRVDMKRFKEEVC